MSLPPDIWARIASFISPSQLEELYSVNRVFFNIAMDQRYQQISFSYLTRKTIRILERIRDPVVAKRVRILYLHPHFVKEVLEKSHTAIIPTISTLLSRLGGIASHLRDQRPFGKKRSRSPSSKFKTFDEFTHVMVDSLSSLPNLTDVHLTWSGLSTLGDRAVPIISSAFVPRLRRLWLEVSLENLRLMLPHISSLADIEEVDLFLRIDHELDAKAYDSILIQTAQTINNLHQTLRKFAIRLWEPLDLSSFFSSLHHLPLLESVSLVIPLGYPHLGDEDAVADFLNLHSSSLQSLSIRATELGEWALPTPHTTLDDWMEAMFSVVRLERLTSLDINLGLISVRAALTCIRKFSGTLKSLALIGSHLYCHDVEAIASAFPHRSPLESVRMGHVTLHPRLLDMLAKKLPHVSKLELLVKEVIPSEDPEPLTPPQDSPGHVQDKLSLQIRFFEEMEQRFYPDWNVNHLILSTSSFPFELQHQSFYKDVLLQCAPSLKSLA